MCCIMHTHSNSTGPTPVGSYRTMCLSCSLDSFSMAASMCFMPPGSLIARVLKLQCAPAPFQSPATGKFQSIPFSSSLCYTWHRLGVKRTDDSKIFTYSIHNVPACNVSVKLRHSICLGYSPSHPEIVSHLDALSWSHLVFPLGRHHLCIGATDSNTSIQASLVVSFHHLHQSFR